MIKKRPTPKGKFKPRADKPESNKDCLCGCGGHPKGRFLPGHDAKLKGRLKKEALGEDSDIAATAVKRLASLGWSWVLDTTPEQKAARKAELEAAKAFKAEIALRRAEQPVRAPGATKTTLAGFSLWDTRRAEALLAEAPMSAAAIAERYRADYAALQQVHGTYGVPFAEAALLNQDSVVRYLRAKAA